jgi:hypothetical protein
MTSTGIANDAQRGVMFASSLEMMHEHGIAAQSGGRHWS